MELAPADLLLIDADVYTVDAARSWAQAIAVKGGRIIAVGTTAQIRELAGPGTQILNCAGRMIVPGFQDSHCHPPASGRDRLRCTLTGVVDREGSLAVVKEYANSHPEEEWIRGGGWSMEAFAGGTPTRQDFDMVV